MKCHHIDCVNAGKIWLPCMVRTYNKGLRPHSFCIRCGMVKNTGMDRSVARRYFINVISQIEKRLNISEYSARKRLVIRDARKIEDFDDAYSMNRYRQDRNIRPFGQ